MDPVTAEVVKHVTSTIVGGVVTLGVLYFFYKLFND